MEEEEVGQVDSKLLTIVVEEEGWVQLRVLAKSHLFAGVLASLVVLFSSPEENKMICDSTRVSTHRRWVGDVMAHLKLEKLKHSTRGSTQRFYKIWQPFLDYFNLEFPARDADTAT